MSSAMKNVFTVDQHLTLVGMTEGKTFSSMKTLHEKK